MNRAFIEYYRCPESLANFRWAQGIERNGHPGSFAFGDGVFGHGSSTASGHGGLRRPVIDHSGQTRIDGAACELGFDPDEVADHLRHERYVDRSKKPAWARAVRGAYYACRPLLPVPIRRHLQRVWLRGWKNQPFPRWPVDPSVDEMFGHLMRMSIAASRRDRIPFIWFWPNGKSSCAIMTHDVETAAGLRYCDQLMDIDDAFSIKSSFQLVPGARYVVTQDQISSITGRGFEVNVHDLKHDGHLFDDFVRFKASAAEINHFGAQFGSKGFRSAVLYRNHEWFGELKFSYDMSVPNVGHLDPQPGGCCTVMPYFIGELLELPVTATQDYTLFHVLQTYALSLWREQIEHIMRHHGLISFIIHPDYLDTERARAAYRGLLGYLSRLRDTKDLWIALPGEVDQWWRDRSKLKLVSDGSGWRIEGSGAERARLAYARLEDERLVYEVA